MSCWRGGRWVGRSFYRGHLKEGRELVLPLLDDEGVLGDWGVGMLFEAEVGLGTSLNRLIELAESQRNEEMTGKLTTYVPIAGAGE